MGKCLPRNVWLGLAARSLALLISSLIFFPFLGANHLTIEACTWSLAIELKPQPSPMAKTTPTPKNSELGHNNHSLST